MAELAFYFGWFMLGLSACAIAVGAWRWAMNFLRPKITTYDKCLGLHIGEATRNGRRG